ncbi:hypothetical protein BDW22DRAFT_1354001 [Trametopsis cervina]|nr:hypothetical protein BDW22DRAFT_1354001 [Trametopsis cervina]
MLSQHADYSPLPTQHSTQSQPQLADPRPVPLVVITPRNLIPVSGPGQPPCPVHARQETVCRDIARSAHVCLTGQRIAQT